MDDLIQTVLDRVLTADPGGIVGVYLYGSSTTTGLGPDRDVDLLLVTRRALTSQERASLVSTLLGLSGWKGHADVFPAVANRRPLEVTSLVTADLKPLVAAPWRDFQFGRSEERRVGKECRWWWERGPETGKREVYGSEVVTR